MINHKFFRIHTLFLCTADINDVIIWSRQPPAEKNLSMQTASILLANVSLYVVGPSARPSVVCNVRAPYSGDWNVRQYFYAVWYIGIYDHSVKILRRSSVGGVKVLNTRGVAEYSDFGPIDGYISETVQDRR